MGGNRRPAALPAVQYLRAIAALMVVVHHALVSFPYIAPPSTYPAFAYGVDIFFVISGFIMVVAASDETPGGFAVRRLVRIVPLYWAATLVLLVKNEKTHLLGLSRSTAEHVGLSLAFVPHYSPDHPGQIWPYLVPGWTLTYELFFYAVFMVGLAWRRPVLTVSAVLPVLVVLGWVFHPTDALLRTVTDQQLLTFTAGAWLGLAYRRLAIPRWLVAAAPIGFAGLLASPAVEHGGFWVRAGSAVLVVLGTVALGTRPLPRFGVELGDASYSIYLTHLVLPVPVAGRLAALLPGPTPVRMGVAIALAVVLSALVGEVVYRYGERPVLRFLRRRLLPGRDRAAVPGPA